MVKQGYCACWDKQYISKLKAVEAGTCRAVKAGMCTYLGPFCYIQIHSCTVFPHIITKVYSKLKILEKHFLEFIQLISLPMYCDMLIHTCMKQDQSYLRQVFYLREDNFGLNCRIILLSKFLIKLLHYLPKIILHDNESSPLKESPKYKQK